ncbi:MAG: hypothetical protein CL607_00685 [Anaerolineaceae bacterium]|nr:hypothetical protein [Anaerolineaceae bacterium]
MRILRYLQETTIGRALIAYFVDLPRWVLLNIAFSVTLLPSAFALILGHVALALCLSFPAAWVLAVMIRFFAKTTDERKPRWSLLWTNIGDYKVVLSAWLCLVIAGLCLLTPFYVVAVIPLILVLMLAPMAISNAECLPVTFWEAWRNAFVMAVHYPIVALGVVLFGGLIAWGISVSGGALLVALPALWASITVYTVHDLIHSLTKQGNTQ